MCTETCEERSASESLTNGCEIHYRRRKKKKKKRISSVPSVVDLQLKMKEGRCVNIYKNVLIPEVSTWRGGEILMNRIQTNNCFKSEKKKGSD